MCFFCSLTKEATEVEKRFRADFECAGIYRPRHMINAFTHPYTAVISHDAKQRIRWYRWGLIPSWAKDDNIRKYTLNARIETLTKKPAFRSSAHNRCLVIADGFYEWKWLDGKGKKKQAYFITMGNNDLFAMGGIWSEWQQRPNGKVVRTFSIVTTEAKGLMREIHNSKKRMPLILDREQEKAWLEQQDIKRFVAAIQELKAKAV